MCAVRSARGFLVIVAFQLGTPGNPPGVSRQGLSDLIDEMVLIMTLCDIEVITISGVSLLKPNPGKTWG